MESLTKTILVCLYPILILGRALNCICGRDPLRLREPTGPTCWIEREPTAVSRASYFSEASESEGRNHRGFGRLATAVLLFVAKLLAPPRKNRSESFSTTVERDRNIPDEVYTLW
jgi:hypothetical protein